MQMSFFNWFTFGFFFGSFVLTAIFLRELLKRKRILSFKNVSVVAIALLGIYALASILMRNLAVIASGYYVNAWGLCLGLAATLYFGALMNYLGYQPKVTG